MLEHKGTKKLETKRLLLRRFTLKDSFYCFKNWQSSKKVTKFLTWKPYENLQEVENNLKKWVELYKNLNFYNWAIVLKSLNQPIGNIAAVKLNEKLYSFEIGFVIGRPWWGRGLVLEAFLKVIEYLFLEVKAKRICANCCIKNVNSAKVIKKCGLKKEGILRKASCTNFGISDLMCFSILNDEFLKKKREDK